MSCGQQEWHSYMTITKNTALVLTKTKKYCWVSPEMLLGEYKEPHGNLGPVQIYYWASPKMVHVESTPLCVNCVAGATKMLLVWPKCGPSLKLISLQWNIFFSLFSYFYQICTQRKCRAKETSGIPLFFAFAQLANMLGQCKKTWWVQNMVSLQRWGKYEKM